MKCSKCGTKYAADPAFARQVNGQNRNHTDAMCRDVLAERLAWFREMPAAIRLSLVSAQATYAQREDFIDAALSQSPTPAHASNTAKRFDDYEKK